MCEKIIILYDYHNDNYYNYYIDYIHWNYYFSFMVCIVYNILELYEYRIS